MNRNVVEEIVRRTNSGLEFCYEVVTTNESRYIFSNGLETQRIMFCGNEVKIWNNYEVSISLHDPDLIKKMKEALHE